MTRIAFKEFLSLTTTTDFLEFLHVDNGPSNLRQEAPRHFPFQRPRTHWSALDWFPNFERGGGNLHHSEPTSRQTYTLGTQHTLASPSESLRLARPVGGTTESREP